MTRRLPTASGAVNTATNARLSTVLDALDVVVVAAIAFRHALFARRRIVTQTALLASGAVTTGGHARLPIVLDALNKTVIVARSAVMLARIAVYQDVSRRLRLATIAPGTENHAQLSVALDAPRTTVVRPA